MHKLENTGKGCKVAVELEMVPILRQLNELCVETLEHVTWFWPFIVLKTCFTRHYDALFWSSIWELRNEAGPLYLFVYLLFLCVYVSAGVSVENAAVSICILSELFSGSLCLSLMILFLSWCIFFLNWLYLSVYLCMTERWIHWAGKHGIQNGK